MIGESLEQQNCTQMLVPSYFSVKEAVFPFNKFPNVDVLLGPEMKSTGEVMGVGSSFGEAFGKAQLGADNPMPQPGKAFISVRDADKRAALVEVGKALIDSGFELVATRGTCDFLLNAGVDCEQVNKVKQGRPHIVDRITNGDINFIINTTEGRKAVTDSYTIRRAALRFVVPYTTTLAGAQATCLALAVTGEPRVRSLQSLHSELTT